MNNDFLYLLAKEYVEKTEAFDRSICPNHNNDNRHVCCPYGTEENTTSTDFANNIRFDLIRRLEEVISHQTSSEKLLKAIRDYYKLRL